MRRPGALWGRRDVSETGFVLGPASRCLACIQRRLCFLGPNDPHTLGLLAREPIVSLMALVHLASSRSEPGPSGADQRRRMRPTPDK
ncbi:MAG: hypothetical protein ACRDZ8_05095 [Acidimicrobiales bacterium]